MLKNQLLAVLVAVFLLAGVAGAEDLTSGLQPGKYIDPFDVVKCSGAPSDGVKTGAELCYRCQYGGRPMVMVFARTSDKGLDALVAELDKAVAANEKQELAAFVNVLGEDRDSAEAAAKKLGAANKLAGVPVVVPIEYENGPGSYGLNPKADVTILLCVEGQVKANHVFAKEGLNKKSVKKVLADLPKIIE